jgi:threonine/homoserine efflux transporter RhtA
MRCFLKSRRNLAVTVGCAAMCFGSLTAAILVGINDNPWGLTLCYVAAGALIVALVHPWRKAKHFLILSGVSVAGFAVFAVLHNLFYALRELTSSITVLINLLGLLHVACFLVAVFACPVGFVVGVVGSAIAIIAHYKRKSVKA